ncbi:hypothetical protein ACWD9K_01730 [Streptomyces sp. 900116325]
MDTDANEVVTVELDCDGWTSPYTRRIMRRQLGELLTQIDDMAETADAAQETCRDAEQRPTADMAYAKAPSVIREIGWTAQAAADKPFGSTLGREFWVRKAAVLDRIALADERAGAPGDAAELAAEAARRLMQLDDSNVICDPRSYARQQYAHWDCNQ